MSFHTKKGYSITFYKTDAPFKTDYARVAPFVMAFAREKLLNAIEPIIDDVVDCHTDGFTLKCYRTELQSIVGDKLGDLKFEGTFNVNY